MASPIPLVPPVTRTRLPANSVGSTEKCVAPLIRGSRGISVPPGRSQELTGGSSRHGLQERVEASARRHDLLVTTGEPRADPLRPLEEGQGWTPLAADAHPPNEAAGIDEAHVFQHASRRRDARGEGTELRDGGDGVRDPAQAEGLSAGQQVGREGLEDASHREPGKDRVVHHGEGEAVRGSLRLLGKGGGYRADETIAAAP